MTRRSSFSSFRPAAVGLASCLYLLLGAPDGARAGEADDLQRMIEVARQGNELLERLDEKKAVRDELTLMGVWLDRAWTLRSAGKYDAVRIVLDRCRAQSDMIRQKISASKLSAEAAAKEEELATVRANLAKTKEAIQAATLEKAALDAKGKR